MKVMATVINIHLTVAGQIILAWLRLPEGEAAPEGREEGIMAFLTPHRHRTLLGEVWGLPFHPATDERL